jgi:hypothetical protein
MIILLPYPSYLVNINNHFRAFVRFSIIIVSNGSSINGSNVLSSSCSIIITSNLAIES